MSSRPGGFLYLADGHPIDVALERDRYDRQGYFDTGRRRYEDAVTYTDGRPLQTRENYRWHHTLADVVTGVVASGLRLEFLHENAFGARPREPTMVQDDRGRWRNPGDPVPLGFSLKATKPSAGSEGRQFG